VIDHTKVHPVPARKPPRDPDTYRGARRDALRDIRRRHYFDRIIRSFQKPKVAALGPWAGAWAFFNQPRPGAKHQIGG
jgi:hypothetical protein